MDNSKQAAAVAALIRGLGMGKFAAEDLVRQLSPEQCDLVASGQFDAVGPPPPAPPVPPPIRWRRSKRNTPPAPPTPAVPTPIMSRDITAHDDEGDDA